MDEATGRTVVVSGTYQAVESAPVGLFDALVAMPRGMIEAAEVIFLVFLIGGAFTVVDQTGVLRRGVTWLVGVLGDQAILVIPIVCLLFATGGALQNMQEEIIALIPVLLILTNRLGYKPMVAVAMSVGAANVGSAFSPINPFQVGIAQKLAQLPLLSGGGFRLLFLALALAIWVNFVMRMAKKTAGEPVLSDDDLHTVFQERIHGEMAKRMHKIASANFPFLTRISRFRVSHNVRKKTRTIGKCHQDKNVRTAGSSSA